MVDGPEIGVHVPGHEVVVERGKVREFARAVMSTDPAHLDDLRPVIPPTWLVTQGFWAPEGAPHAAAGLDFDPARLLHAGQEFRFLGTPPRAGDVLRTEWWIDRVYDKEGRRGGTMRFAEIVTAYRDRTGSVVAEERMILVETAAPPTGGP